jgi:hypothetical protein
MTSHRSKRLALTAALLACPALAEEDNTGFFKLPGTGTRLKVYGMVQVYGQYCFNQFLYDNGPLLGGDTDPRDAGSTPDRQFTMTARTSLFGFRTLSDTASLGTIETKLELGFDGGGPNPKGRPKLNQAWIGVRDWTLGYTTSNWVDLDAAPETVDSAGPIGNSCNSRGSYTQVRYKLRINDRAGLAFSIEQNQLAHKSFGAAEDPNPEDVNGDRPTTIQPDARYPSVVAAGTWADTWGHLGLRLLAQNYGANRPASAGASRPNRWAPAIQLSGHAKVGAHKLVGSVYTGAAVGYYGFSPQGARFDLDGGHVLFYRSTGWQAGYTHNWNPKLRSNLILTGLYFRDDPTVVRDRDIRRAHNAFVNTIIKLNKHFEVGMEYGFENLKTFGPNAVVQRDGITGDTNRSNKLQVTLTAKF